MIIASRGKNDNIYVCMHSRCVKRDSVSTAENIKETARPKENHINAEAMATALSKANSKAERYHVDLHFGYENTTQ